MMADDTLLFGESRASSEEVGEFELDVILADVESFLKTELGLEVEMLEREEGVYGKWRVVGPSPFGDTMTRLLITARSVGDNRWWSKDLAEYTRSSYLIAGPKMQALEMHLAIKVRPSSMVLSRKWKTRKGRRLMDRQSEQGFECLKGSDACPQAHTEKTLHWPCIL
jgi:hypothetical protein